jgi:outer membrane protein OmpA-like peptidoglycan-associated protein
MAHKGKKHEEEEGGESAPLWIISFADMISLLMAFFVMLSTFATFGPSEKDKLIQVARSAMAPNLGFGMYDKKRHDSVQQSPATSENNTGSEKPTTDESDNKKNIKETFVKDYKTHKVFSMESKNIFWGGGVTLSKEGKEFLDKFASFIKKVPGRIVISEYAAGDNENELGINRAIVVLEYLAKRGVAKSWCNISSQTNLNANNSKERMLEITILDEQTYR